MLIKDFIFNNIKLSDMGYMMCSFDGDMDTIMVGSHITFNTTKSANNNSRRYTSVTFEEVLTTKFQIAKYDCKNDVLSYLDIDDVREIMRWLNCHANKKLIFLDDQDGYDQVFFLGSFPTIDIIRKGSRIVGLELTFVSCLSYALSHDVISTFNVSESGTIILRNDDDCYGYNIPKKIEIEVLQDGLLYIDNNVSGLRTSIANCTSGEVITIDGNILWLESSDNNHDIHNDFNYNFIKIVRNEETDENTLTFSLPCRITVISNYIRKVGII